MFRKTRSIASNRVITCKSFVCYTKITKKVSHDKRNEQRGACISDIFDTYHEPGTGTKAENKSVLPTYFLPFQYCVRTKIQL